MTFAAKWLTVLCVVAMALACDDAGAAAPATGQKIRLQTVIKGLSSPVDFLSDGSPDRTFVVEQPGRMRLIVKGRLESSPYLNIAGRVTHQGELGFLGAAFHPAFASNGYFYVNYSAGSTREGNLRTVLAEFHADPKARSVDPSTERILLELPDPYTNHNGGQVQFGPDGMLYTHVGDAGNGGDPQNRAQDPQSLFGKIWRLDVNQRTPYGIPRDNPFINDPRFRPEIYALGLRNAWRFSFDRKTGTCFAGDVGQNLYEEVDVIVAGGNYGWRIREGLHPFKGDERPITGTLIDPIAEYGRDKGMSITGGVVYRGKKFPVLDGVYFYADYNSGRFWGLKYENGKTLANEELRVTINGQPTVNRVQPSAFGQDKDGEVYVCDHSRGNVYMIVAE
jgi:glucose/arabinose dehydrogenase